MTDWNSVTLQGLPEALAGLEDTPNGGGRNYVDARDYGAVGDGVTDDWAALWTAIQAAGARPVFLPTGHYKISQPLVFEEGGLLGESVGIVRDNNACRISAIVNGAHDIIQLVPPSNDNPFFFRHLMLTSGLIGFHGISDIANRRVWRDSVFDNIRVAGCTSDGFAWDKLWAIGCMFMRLHAENNGGHGIRFSGRAQLNAAQFINGRSAFNRGAGWLFENTNSNENIPAVGLVGCTAEWNDGPGIHFKGYNAGCLAPYLEGNDLNQDGYGPDLFLESNPDGSVKSQITCIDPYFGPVKHPDNVRISGIGGSQGLILINPKFMSTNNVIDAGKLNLQMAGVDPAKVVIRQAITGMPAVSFALGMNLTGAKSVTGSPVSIGIPAASPKGAVLQVLAADRDSDGSHVAQYLVRRGIDGTIVSTLVGGDDILAFDINTAGMITIAAKAGQVTYSITGY